MKTAQHKCDNCEKVYSDKRMQAHNLKQQYDIPHLWERTEAGGIMPSGECLDEDCRSLCYLIVPKRQDPRLMKLIKAARAVLKAADNDIYWDAHDYPNESDKGLANFRAAIANLQGALA